MVEEYRRFRRICYSHHQVVPTPMMEARGSSETSPNYSFMLFKFADENESSSIYRRGFVWPSLEMPSMIDCCTH